MKIVVAYCRVSTDGQSGEDKFGIEAQRKQITDYCEKNDMFISDWFIDEGVSGSDLRRPAFDRLLAGEVTNPPVEYVVMSKTDRLARDVNLYYSFKSELSRLGLEIISVSEDWSAQDKLTGMILENFLAMAATLERENITRRTSGGRSIKASRGGYSGGRSPFGYKVENKKLVIEPTEADTVKMVFELRNSGSTYQQIVDALNSEGRVNKSGGKFSISTVQVILGNEKLYKGMYKYGNSEWVDGQHSPILEVE